MLRGVVAAGTVALAVTLGIAATTQATPPTTASSIAGTSTETVHITANHPWLTADRGWVDAGNLKPGESVVTLGGATETVAGVHGVPGQADMYNLTVAQDHTYAVGASQAVVHNTCDGDLVSTVQDEYARMKDPNDPSYLSNSQRGPVLTGVKDRMTGQIVTSLNYGVESNNLHPSFSARLNGAELGDLYPGGSGIHGEIHGLNELLWTCDTGSVSALGDGGHYSNGRVGMEVMVARGLGARDTPVRRVVIRVSSGTL